MTLNDVLQFFIVLISVSGILLWAIRLRHWPMMLAAVISLSFNLLFLIVRSAGFWTSGDMNQLSLARILLLTIVVAAVPFSTTDTKQ